MFNILNPRMDKSRTISLCIIVIDHVYNRKKWYSNPTCTRPKIGFLNSTTNLMAWEGLDGLVLSNLANMYRAISGTRCKRNIVSPIDIQSWSWKIFLSWLTSYRSRNLTDTLKNAVPEWNSNCCFHSPLFMSHTIAVLSTLPLRR